VLKLLRVVGITALVLSVADLSVSRPGPGGEIVILRDRSKSISQTLSGVFDAEIGALGKSFTPRVIDFAAEAPAGPDRSTTDIAAAIRASGVGAVVLLSDGRQNKGDAVSAAKSIGVEISVPSGVLNSNEGELRPEISYLTAPPVIKNGEKFLVAVGVKNSSQSSGKFTLKLFVNGKEVSNENLQLKDGESKGINEKAELFSLKDAEIRAELWGEGLLDQRIIYVSAQESDDIKLYSYRAEDARFISQVIKDAGYKLDEKIGEPLPTAGAAGALVILNNLSASEAGPGAEKLEEFVRAGGRLLIIGGPNSFGLGRYQDTALDRVSPLKSLPPEREKKRLNVGVALVIDKSRSMASNYKIDFAKDAAREVVKNLKDDDLLTVIGFDAAPFVAVSLGYLKNIRQSALQRVGMLFPAGRTNLLPSIDEARRALQRAEAGRKHVIILTDGKVPDEGPFYLTLIREMRLAGITVSTVLLGSNADPGMLKQLAELGGGTFYQTNDPSSLPRIFLKEVYVQGGDRTLQESSNYMVRPGSRGALSTTLSSFPTLRGYLRTEVKSGADEELIVGEAPLLGSWRLGQGRVVAFASDVSGRWSSEWIGWPRFREFWGDVISSFGVVGDSGDTTLDLRTSFVGDEAILSLVSYGVASGEVAGTIDGPSGKQVVNFSQVAPGRFEGRAKLAGPGKYTLTPKLNGKIRNSLPFNVDESILKDTLGQPVNRGFLRELVGVSGGKVYSSPSELTGAESKQVKRFNGLFVAAGLLALLLEIILREVRRGKARVLRS
jgi:Ca-activated chloride channel family protein